MKNLVIAALASAFLGSIGFAQSRFEVTGSRVPLTLLKRNYGRVPKDITAYDLDICNSSHTKQSIVSSEIYQAVSMSNPALQPLGKQAVLASILRTQNWSIARMLAITASALTAAVSIAASSKHPGTAALVTAAAAGALSAGQIMAGQRPAISADQLQKFDAQTLEPALVLDSGSCVERTMFTAASTSRVMKPAALSFHVR